MTRDIKAALIAKIERLLQLDNVERCLEISDILDDLSSDRVSVLQVVSDDVSSPVPAYDAAEDGDYGAWLVRHNID